jgi:hypothetical protein
MDSCKKGENASLSETLIQREIFTFQFAIAQIVLELQQLLYINPLKPNGCYMYHLLQHTKTLHSDHRVYLCIPYGSHNKQRRFPKHH